MAKVLKKSVFHFRWCVSTNYEKWWFTFCTKFRCLLSSGKCFRII